MLSPSHQMGSHLYLDASDCTVKLWDMQTGGIVRTFTGPTGGVLSVSISSDSTTIASGFTNGSIHLWDSQTWECCCVIEQLDFVGYISFSPTDPQYFLSICGFLQSPTVGYQWPPSETYL
jgi:WD40 repeat protein